MARRSKPRPICTGAHRERGSLRCGRNRSASPRVQEVMTDTPTELRLAEPPSNLAGPDQGAVDPAADVPSLSRGLETWRIFLQAHATVVRRLEAELEASGLIS